MTTSARREAIKQAKSLLQQNPIYLDTETTGTGPNDNILELAIIDHDGSVLLDQMVKPVGAINPEAASVHGITAEMVKDAPRWNKIWPEVEAFLTGRLLGIYNAEFDIRMMQQSHTQNWMKWVQPPNLEIFCIMKLYAQFYGDWNHRRGSYRWQSLDAAGRQCRIALPNTHRALDDTLLTREILHFIAKAG